MNHPYNSPVRVPRFRNLVFVVEESLGTDDIYFIYTPQVTSASADSKIRVC
jgi:hypothetical protein